MEAHDHERAWAEALATEHAHQRELLAALRDELGTFARECASALTALDALVGLGGVAGAVAAARTQAQHASLAADLSRRLYESLGGDVEHPLVHHADELLRAQPPRSDRELLAAVVSASGVSARVEEIVGPAPWAAAAALRPLAKWARQLGDPEQRRELRESAAADLAQVLDSAAQLGAGADTALAGETAAVADSLRDTVAHVEAAARAVRDGKLDAVLAELRRTLEEDLERLRGVHESAHAAPQEWRDARRAEHAELTEEVRTKLERVERIRAVLGRLLPHLQAVARALSTLEQAHALEGRLEPHLEAVRTTLLASTGELWAAAFGASAAPAPRARPPRRRVRARWLVAAVVLLAAAILGAVLTRGSSKPSTPPAAAATTAAATTTTAAATPAPKPDFGPVKASFSEAQRATFYTVALLPGAAYSWRLTPPKDNAGCNRFQQLKPNEAVWHHADTDGCAHTGFQHLGTVHVTVTTPDWTCTESFFGTLTKTGTRNERCVRR